MSVTWVFEENISIKLQFTSYSTKIILHNALFLHPGNAFNVTVVNILALVRRVVRYLCCMSLENSVVLCVYVVSL